LRLRTIGVVVASALAALPAAAVANTQAGSYNLPLHAPRVTARVAPGIVPAGAPVTFIASGTDADTGDVLTYQWSFDDGAGADGASVQHAFAVPGMHFGTVSAVDLTGLQAFATTSVYVTAVVPRYPGVVIAAQHRRMRKGRVAVVVSCPAATTGRCLGSLVLRTAGKVKIRTADRRPTRPAIRRIGRAAVDLAAGERATVRIRVPGHIRALVRRRPLATVVVATTRDASGLSKRTRARLVLSAPQPRRGA
jgi:hypothetical protein